MFGLKRELVGMRVYGTGFRESGHFRFPAWARVMMIMIMTTVSTTFT